MKTIPIKTLKTLLKKELKIVKEHKRICNDKNSISHSYWVGYYDSILSIKNVIKQFKRGSI